MKKKIIGAGVLAAMLISGTAFAAAYKNPAQSLSDLTKMPIEKIYEQRQEGKTFGQIASENGVLDKFKEENLNYKKSIIDERVKNGTLTQEQADVFKKELEERMKNCDGTPDGSRARLGQKYGGGMRFGGGMGMGQMKGIK